MHADGHGPAPPTEHAPPMHAGGPGLGPPPPLNMHLPCEQVVLDLGRPPLARFPSGDEKLSPSPVTKEDLEYAIAQARRGDGRDAGIGRGGSEGGADRTQG